MLAKAPVPSVWRPKPYSTIVIFNPPGKVQAKSYSLFHVARSIYTSPSQKETFTCRLEWFEDFQIVSWQEVSFVTGWTHLTKGHLSNFRGLMNLLHWVHAIPRSLPKRRRCVTNRVDSGFHSSVKLGSCFLGAYASLLQPFIIGYMEMENSFLVKMDMRSV